MLGAFAWSQQWAPTLAQLPPLVLLATSQVGAQVAGTLLTKELELVGASLLGTLGLEEEWFPRLQLGHCWVPQPQQPHMSNAITNGGCLSEGVRRV